MALTFSSFSAHFNPRQPKPLWLWHFQSHDGYPLLTIAIQHIHNSVLQHSQHNTLTTKFQSHYCPRSRCWGVAMCCECVVAPTLTTQHTHNTVCCNVLRVQRAVLWVCCGVCDTLCCECVVLRVLQHTVVNVLCCECCNTLLWVCCVVSVQCVAMCCGFVVVCCRVLPCVAVCCWVDPLRVSQCVFTSEWLRNDLKMIHIQIHMYTDTHTYIYLERIRKVNKISRSVCLRVFVDVCIRVCKCIFVYIYIYI